MKTHVFVFISHDAGNLTAERKLMAVFYRVFWAQTISDLASCVRCHLTVLRVFAGMPYLLPVRKVAVTLVRICKAAQNECLAGAAKRRIWVSMHRNLIPSFIVIRTVAGRRCLHVLKSLASAQKVVSESVASFKRPSYFLAWNNFTSSHICLVKTRLQHNNCFG